MNPKCFKCGASPVRFSIWEMELAGNNVRFLYCMECGAVQGVLGEEK